MAPPPVSRFALIAFALATAAPAWPAAPAVSETGVRAFVARQERAWNQGALDAYYAGFTADARFTDQYRTPGGQIVPYGTSTLAGARAQSRRFRQAATIAESGRILRIAPAPDGRSAEVALEVVSRIRGPKGPRTTCAERRQTVVATPAGLRSSGQTDTFRRCGR